MKRFIFCSFLLLIFNCHAFGKKREAEACEKSCNRQRCEKAQCDDRSIRSYTEPSGFYIGVMGMFAVPTETGLGTFTHSVGLVNDQGGVTCKGAPSEASFGTAGGIQVGYDFANSGNRLEAAYFYLHNSKHSVEGLIDTPFTFGSSFFNVGVLAPPGTPLPPSYLKYTLNQGDLKFGHRLITGSCFFEFTPTVGVRYASLKHDLPFTGGYVRSTYWGAGPMLGFDLIYNLYKGLLLVGQFNAALLMGAVKSSSALNFPADATNVFKSPSNSRIVSNFEGRLGMAYDYIFCNRSSIRLEAGYEMNNYIGPFDMIVSYVAPVQRISDLETTSFAYSGPYLKLTWHM